MTTIIVILFAMILAWSIKQNRQKTNELQNQIRDLEAAEDIFHGSLITYSKFLLVHNVSKRPLLSLTPDNEIYALWKIDNNNLLGVRFLADDVICYAVFLHDKKYSGTSIIHKLPLETIHFLKRD